MILEIDNVELYFSNKRILNGIYLKAELGKTTAMLGSNGCGKSCLLEIIFGALKSKYKLVRLDNKVISKPLYKTGLASLLPQHDLVPNSLKIKNVFKVLGVDWNAFVLKFETFSKYKNLKMNLVSGGERRVIETYLILKGKSKIVLLDEPFSHLAPLYIEHFKVIINEEKKRKIIIITDHMYKHVIDIADSIYLLNGGHTKHISDLKDLETYKYLSLGSIE